MFNKKKGALSLRFSNMVFGRQRLAIYVGSYGLTWNAWLPLSLNPLA